VSKFKIHAVALKVFTTRTNGRPWGSSRLLTVG
jgi:hypothetical protein